MMKHLMGKLNRGVAVTPIVNVGGKVIVFLAKLTEGDRGSKGCVETKDLKYMSLRERVARVLLRWERG